LKYKFFIFIFLVILVLLFYPITFITEFSGTVRIYCSGMLRYFYFSDEQTSFSQGVGFFYKEFLYDDYAVLNTENSIFRINRCDNAVQIQKEKETAYVFVSKDYLSFTSEDTSFVCNKKWLAEEAKDINDYFREKVIFPSKMFVIYANIPRSFHISPYVIFVNSIKDMIHEFNHYTFGYYIKDGVSDTWAEILCETNTLLYLKKKYPMLYESELELKSIGFYPQEYGSKVMDFYKKFNCEEIKIFSFEKSLIDSQKKMNDKVFYSLLGSE